MFSCTKFLLLENYNDLIVENKYVLLFETGSHYIAPAGLEFTEIHPSLPWVLEIKLRATLAWDLVISETAPNIPYIFKHIGELSIDDHKMINSPEHQAYSAPCGINYSARIFDSLYENEQEHPSYQYENFL